MTTHDPYLAGQKAWRTVVQVFPHPDNGRGKGGAVVGTVCARLACGHINRTNKSRRIEVGCSMRCKACEAMAKEA